MSNATVEIHLEKRGEAPIIFNAAAGKDGGWEATYENIIPSGAYEVWAKQILDTGAESLQSNTVYIGVNSCVNCCLCPGDRRSDHHAKVIMAVDIYVNIYFFRDIFYERRDVDAHRAAVDAGRLFAL